MANIQKQNEPALRFPEFSGEWFNYSLNEVSIITTGSTPATANSLYYDGPRMFVSPSDIEGVRYVRNTKTTLSELGFSKGRKIEKDSVLFVCIGSTIGKIAQCSEECITNQQINALSSKDSISNNFIYSLLEGKSPRIKLLAGVQAVPQINKSDFSKLRFYFPELLEQQKISSFLSSVDTKIEQLDNKKALLEQYKKGMMQKLFSQEIRFKDDAGNVFPEWKSDLVKEIFKNVSTRPYQIKTSEIQSAGKSPVVDQGKEAVRGYSDEMAKIYKGSETPVVVFGDHTTELKYIDFDFVIGADGTKLLVPKKGSTRYFYYALIFNNVDQEGYKRHFSILKSVELFIPEIQEQQKVASFLSSIDQKIELVSTQLELAKSFKKGLLQQMFV